MQKDEIILKMIDFCLFDLSNFLDFTNNKLYCDDLVLLKKYYKNKKENLNILKNLNGC